MKPKNGQACSVSDCPDPIVGRVEVVTDLETDHWLCAEHIVEEAEKVRDEPDFYGLPKHNLQ